MNDSARILSSQSSKQYGGYITKKYQKISKFLVLEQKIGDNT